MTAHLDQSIFAKTLRWEIPSTRLYKGDDRLFFLVWNSGEVRKARAR